MSAEILASLEEIKALIRYQIGEDVVVEDDPDTEADDGPDGYFPFQIGENFSYHDFLFFKHNADQVFNGERDIEAIRRANGDDYAARILDYIENNPAYYDGV